MAQIDQVTVVGQHMFRRDSNLGQVGLERRDAFFTQRPGVPLALVFGEQGEGPRVNGPGVEGRVFHAARSTHMGSDIFHEHMVAERLD